MEAGDVAARAGRTTAGNAGSRRTARWTATHAVLIGVAWIPLVIGIWFVPALRPDGGVLPDWLVGSLFLVGAIFVIPLFWPVLIAIALYEGSLAERIAGGDRRAAGSAARLVGGLGLAFGVIAAAVAVVSVLSDPWPARHEFVTWAWLGPAALGAAHLVLARSLNANANGKVPIRRLT